MDRVSCTQVDIWNLHLCTISWTGMHKHILCISYLYISFKFPNDNQMPIRQRSNANRSNANVDLHGFQPASQPARSGLRFPIQFVFFFFFELLFLRLSRGESSTCWRIFIPIGAGLYSDPAQFGYAITKGRLHCWKAVEVLAHWFRMGLAQFSVKRIDVSSE